MECSKVFESYYNFKRHMSAHRNKFKYKYVCKYFSQGRIPHRGPLNNSTICLFIKKLFLLYPWSNPELITGLLIPALLSKHKCRTYGLPTETASTYFNSTENKQKNSINHKSLKVYF